MGLPKYILNLEEFSKLYGDLTLDIGNVELETILKENLEEILRLLKLLIASKTCGCIDMSKHIPAIDNKFLVTKIFSHDVMLTGITFSQSAWKVEDTISLKVAEVTVIDEIHTKELGQGKVFFSAFFVPSGEEITLIYNNKSGNSKMFFCDLDYIKIEREEEKNGKGI